MEEQLKARLSTLKHEFEMGQTRLHDLEIQEASLRETLLRISGAIQVLEELLNEQKVEVANPDGQETKH
jgi:predicted nuclease with TOPRIM domain